MKDDFLDEYQSISKRVNQVIKEANEMRSTKSVPRSANKVLQPTNKGPRPGVKGTRPVVQAPRSANLLKPRRRTFFDLVEKSRALDKKIKQSRKDGRDVKERLQDLEEFSKISEEMENID